MDDDAALKLDSHESKQNATHTVIKQALAMHNVMLNSKALHYVQCHNICQTQLHNKAMVMSMTQCLYNVINSK